MISIPKIYYKNRGKDDKLDSERKGPDELFLDELKKNVQFIEELVLT